MRNILKKEFRLSAAPTTFLFILFGLMFFLPGYPILCGVFFVTFGIFQFFQNGRENNDILFTVLLPIAKTDAVKGKFLFVCFIELCSLLLMGTASALRVTVLSGLAAYKNNALMNANFFAMALALFMFGLFNAVFLGGFFKTAYKTGKPFAVYAVCAFFTVIIGETLHHIPGLAFLNAPGAEYPLLRLLLPGAGLAVFALLTLCACRRACRRFENIDL